jgi:hypothetical protein
MGPYSVGNNGTFQEGSAVFRSGPGGIRTLGLFSAIEARSQLRYRPFFKVVVDFTAMVFSRQAGRFIA